MLNSAMTGHDCDDPFDQGAGRPMTYPLSSLDAGYEEVAKSAHYGLWQPSAQNLFEEASPLHCELQHEAARIIQKCFRSHGPHDDVSDIGGHMGGSLQTSAISSGSISEIIDHVDQGFIRAVEFYDSCRTLVASMVDGRTRTIVEVPRHDLSHMLVAESDAAFKS